MPRCHDERQEHENEVLTMISKITWTFQSITPDRDFDLQSHVACEPYLTSFEFWFLCNQGDEIRAPWGFPLPDVIAELATNHLLADQIGRFWLDKLGHGKS